MSLRRWIRGAGIALGVAALAVLAAPLATLLPLLRDDLVLDRIVVAVALDWRDFGLERARQRLQYELDHQGVGAQVDEGACTLTPEPGDEVRAVSCRWEVRVALPLVGTQLPLAFESVARIDRRGALLR